MERCSISAGVSQLEAVKRWLDGTERQGGGRQRSYDACSVRVVHTAQTARRYIGCDFQKVTGSIYDKVTA